MEAERLDREVIAMRVARELKDGDVVNLGIGIPTLCPSSYRRGARCCTTARAASSTTAHGGARGGGRGPDQRGGQFLAPYPGMSFFNSAEAFAMIRGGHVDVAVLGALQVSEKGDLANWMLPERGIGNVGGAMDLAAGARRIIVAMEHTDRRGNPKL